ncbi:hypothetical protein GCM10010983_35340 [Caulobacter rhizosphaerae]|nr:hypothetical protein GCM10010983_35340 [Caulobacter rhizosphaerae]
MVLAMGAALLAPAVSVAGPLRAGAARVDITPTPSVLPASIHDPLFVRTLILDSGKDKVLLVSIDSPGLARTDELLDSLAKELQVPRDHILMAATHDHSAPFMALGDAPYPYFDLIKKGVLDAARQANARLRPARIGYRTGKAYVNSNRDEKIAGRYTMGYAPEGPSDKTVAVMAVTDMAGKPIAVYANYAVHGVVMFFSKTKDGQLEITGDLPGATSRYVEEHLGPDVVALWTSGAAGDQNPIFTSVYLTQDGAFKDSGVGGWTLLDAQARRLGEEIVRVVNATSDTTDSAELKVRTTVLVCPGQAPAKPGAPPLPAATSWAPTKVEMVDGAPVKIPLTLMTVGDIALAGVGGEVFTEIGMAVKAQSPFDRTMVVTHLPGNVGYIPTDRAFALPSEKALTATMKPGCADPGIPATFKDMAAGLLVEGKTEK